MDLLLMPDFPSRWIRPDWPAPAHVQAVMTDRMGGVSFAPWDSMNLGDHVGDCPDSVRANRTLLAGAVGRRPVFLQQVHGVDVLTLATDTPDGLAADACVTDRADVACTIMVADCLPVLMCDAAGQWVAAAHAGWRGLAGEGGQGVLEKLRASGPLAQTAAADILVWLGPCIGPLAFEVGPEVKAVLCARDAQASRFFKPGAHGKFMADLAGLARRRLQNLGIAQVFGNNSLPQWCTATQASSFFSHRRDSRLFGHTGRMAAAIWLER